ncbi:MAG TPA: hypothetical protein VG860_00030 [Terriglobia bacterium]|jgi:hypothetical protein|nr:hypothetical protein [Terriglobia bacterium]
MSRITALRFLSYSLCALLAASLFTMTRQTSASGLKPANITTIASTVPANGDVNPYGIVMVPTSVGNLVQGNILVSNFNNSQNLQGTGTTIVQINPNGATSLFAQIDASTLPGPCPGGVGLTTALAVLKTGWVIVGSLPTTDGTSATAQAGCLLVLSSSGQVVETFYGSLINGPWDMTWTDQGTQASLYFSNVLNGTVAANGNVVNGGTVVRMDLAVAANSMPAIESMTVIGSRFPERTDPAALVIGPTGLGLSGTNLYVADTLSNRIAVIANAPQRTTSVGVGATLTSGGGLNGPLGLTVSPSGNILSVNGANGYLIVTTPAGEQIEKVLLDSSGSPPGAGALFGIVAPGMSSIFYVDDATNTLNLFQ